MRPWRWQVLALLCGAGLCPAALAQTPDPTAGEAVQGFQVRVATINMWGIPYVSTYIDERFAALAERLNTSDLDVVGLQEVWADGPRLALRTAVQDRFPYQADFQSDTGGSGLLILSRWPIAEQHFSPFPVNGKPWKPWHGDWWGKKGVGIVRLDAPDGPIWFATTHLHARYTPRLAGGDGMDDEYAYDRWHQVHEVRALVRRYADWAPAVVVGDFNFRPGSRYHDFLESEHARDPAHASDADPPWQDAGHPSGEAKRIDYIWCRPGRGAEWAPVDAPRSIFAEPVPVDTDLPQRLTDHPAVGAVLQCVRMTPRGASSSRETGGHPQSAVLGARPSPGWATWHPPARAYLAMHAGGEVLLMLTGGLTLVGLAGGVLPWRMARRRSWTGVIRGALGAGLLFAGFWAVQVSLDVARVRAGAAVFWEHTGAAGNPEPPEGAVSKQQLAE